MSQPNLVYLVDFVFYKLKDERKKMEVKPKDVGILVINYNLFNSSLLLLAIIVDHYKMYGNILSLNFGDIGCFINVTGHE
uniref:FAE domain-containing protein n=1 Tax=Physcomitrium patens TaxID=3218 RepID=A0A2K1JG89_PHYPA|nr:hypothetical protein PHYPA_017921 [Physcomitrium patens]